MMCIERYDEQALVWRDAQAVDASKLGMMPRQFERSVVRENQDGRRIALNDNDAVRGVHRKLADRAELLASGQLCPMLVGMVPVLSVSYDARETLINSAWRSSLTRPRAL
ncbi:hypothetical protein WL23_06480 [Burkholderia multivorans]|nr:hypothetical protein WL23_06480 [Burkholderia multivorans]